MPVALAHDRTLLFLRPNRTRVKSVLVFVLIGRSKVPEKRSNNFWLDPAIRAGMVRGCGCRDVGLLSSGWWVTYLARTGSSKTDRPLVPGVSVAVDQSLSFLSLSELLDDSVRWLRGDVRTDIAGLVRRRGE